MRLDGRYGGVRDVHSDAGYWGNSVAGLAVEQCSLYRSPGDILRADARRLGKRGADEMPEMIQGLKMSVKGGRWCIWNAREQRWVRLRKDVNPEVVTVELDLLVERLMEK
jgi:hypothetical protein